MLNFLGSSRNCAKMSILFGSVILTFIVNFIAVRAESSILVKDGVYTRVTVQIEPQPQPDNCVEFLDQLEAILNETSFGLHRLTQRQGLIHDYEIVLPKSWNIPSCQPGRQMTSVQKANPTRPDIMIDAKLGPIQSQIGPRPWTEQPQGCGEPGFGIHVPSRFLDLERPSPLYKDSWELRTKGQVMLKEWCKYRYGIFPENGFTGDSLYPTTYQEGNTTLASQGCIQQDILCPLGQLYNRAAPTKQNLLCDEQSAIEVVLNHKDFQTTWESVYAEQQKPHHEQQQGSSSQNQNILDNLNLDLVSQFSNLTSFTTTTTTTTTTTSLPPHLVYPVSAKEFESPVFKYIVPKSRRYVLLLERSSIMDVNERWTNIRRALYRFIQYLPTGSELSIISFGIEAKVNLPPTVVTDTNREGLHGRIPRKVLMEDNACTYCALNTSLKALQNYMGQLETGTLILVSGSSSKPVLLNNILKSIKQVPLQVFPILYPASIHPDLIHLAAYGKVYSIPEGEESSAVTPLNYLSEVLLDVLHLAEGLRIQKIHETKHLSYEFAGTFTMEQDILHKMHVTLSVDDENKVEFFEVTNPSGKKHLFSQFEDGMVVFSHPGIAQAGIWTYHAKLYPNTGLSTNSKMTVDVVSQSNNAEAEPFMLEVFSNSDETEIDAFSNNPVILYARLTKGNAPVIGANVRATIFRPGGPDTNPPVALMMRDNGAGYPDITADDGIYSVYFTDFATVPGFYSVQVSADNNGGSARTPRLTGLLTSSQLAATAGNGISTEDSNIHAVLTDDSDSCCGSHVTFGDTIPASSFMRQAAGPTFYVKQGLSGRRDVVPPSRVIDFHVSQIVNDSLYVALEWTAPGNNYDQGKAFKYEIRCYTNRDALNQEATFTKHGILVHDSFTPQPLEYGTAQTCTVGVPWPNEVIYYGLVSIDEAGNRSPISNILSVYIYEAPTTTTTTTTTTTSDPLTGDAVPLYGSEVRHTNGGTTHHNHGMAWSKHMRVYIATGVICGLLLIVIAVIIFILVRVRSQKRSTTYDTEAKDTYKAYEPSQAGNGNNGQKQTLTSWLDSLPRSEMHNTLRSSRNETGTGNGGQHSPNTTALHDLSISESHNGTLRRGTNSNTHTLTKTNPYRHKVLTNGSFLNLNLKEGPLASSGSDDASNSSRPTTSTEDPNSDSENQNKINLRRSKSTNMQHQRGGHHHNGGHHGGLSNQQPDLLPPPDGFDNTMPRQNIYPIDAKSAKAIIDTYSGHLFSRSTNYFSFRGDNSTSGSGSSSSNIVLQQQHHPSSAVEKLFTRDPTNMDQDSLDNTVHSHLQNNNSPSNYYQHSVLVPPNNQNINNNNSGPRVKTRTESVV